MSKEDFETLKDLIESIPSADTKIPHMPIDVFLQEAYDLYLWSTEDQDKLLEVGIKAKDFDEFIVRIGALSYAQSTWINNRYQKGAARQQWNKKSKKAEEFKTELEHAFRFAFRKRPDLLKKARGIEKGARGSDMIQDLSDLSSLGKANLDLLKAINFDEKRLDQAASEATELSFFLAKARSETKEKASLKSRRDKAYTYLLALVDEVYEAGKYIFRKDKEKRKGYFSRYLNKR